MKKFTLFIAIAAATGLFFISCRQNTAPVTAAVSYGDTVGLAQFQAWKAMNERVDPNEVFTTSAQAPVKKAATQKVTMSSSSTHEAKVERKKGWSKAAKYSAIGGGSGIVLGAVINKKNRVAGGAIGGVVLGGLGYIIGRSQDKKDGRY